MTILIVEQNLMWSERLRRSVAGLGHTAIVVPPGLAEIPQAEMTVVNLADKDAGS